MDLRATLDDLRRYLPIQFPLGVFIHNNMLLNFEDRPFEQGVAEAAALFGAQRALPEVYYLEKWRQGRVLEGPLSARLEKWVAERGLKGKVAGREWPRVLRALLLNPLVVPHQVKGEGGADWATLAARLRAPAPLTHERSGKSWKRCLLHDYGEDVNGLFHSVLIRFLSAYLDQGMATWHNPDTHAGLLESFRAFLEANRGHSPAWMKRLHEELPLAMAGGEAWLGEWLHKIPWTDDPRTHLLHSLLELRGWAGMVNKFELEPHLIPRHAPKIRLMDYLTLYLLLERSAYDAAMERQGLATLPAFYEAAAPAALTGSQATYVLAHVGAALGWRAPDLAEGEAQVLLDTACAFDAVARGQVWQDAFDLSVRDMCLDTLALYRRECPPLPVPSPLARVYFCIDDREESLRRLLEEANPRLETHGVVGFFGIDMKFKSAHHPEPVAHCPPVVSPAHTVEEVVEEDGAGHSRRLARWGQGRSLGWYATRGGLSSLTWTLLTGPFTSLLLLVRVFFPRLAGRLHLSIKRRVVAAPATTIRYASDQAKGGYQVAEMAGIVATILRFTGTVADFPRLCFMVGHGASSSNNPFKNAYGCGACGGKAGIPNSQIFCGMANRGDVREELRRSHGIDIPSETWFVACYHDTSTDGVACFNLDSLPPSHRPEAENILADIRRAAASNSLERCRHFASARRITDEKITFRHVQDRANNLAEPRPEYGHTNNALCVVGRRSLTRHLYLDRRSFLVSYDAKTDPEGKALAGVLAGAVPVCGGINLDYYFSRVDNETYGSGTKLPLNVAALLGVMTGGNSDLRIGLARQMVELHEPARITVVVEAEEAVVARLVEDHPRMRRLVHNQWLFLAVIHPDTGEVRLFEGGAFRPYFPTFRPLPTVPSSRDHVAHRSGPLPFVRVTRGEGRIA